MYYTQCMSIVKSRREQYSDATRAALLETATSMFAERGYDSTALADVAAAAHVTRGAVYHHFENKKALFQAVLEELETAAMHESQQAYAGAGDPLAGAFAALDSFLDQASDPVYGEIVWHQGPLALGWDQWKLCEQQFGAGLIEQIITSLVDAGKVQPLPIGTASAIVFSMLGGAGMALADADPEDKPRVKDECTEVIGRLMSGLLV